MNYLYEKILVIGDNQEMMEFLYSIIEKQGMLLDPDWNFCCSPGHEFQSKLMPLLSPIDLKKDIQILIKRFHLILSVHCRQIFPKELVDSVKCINIHPGLIPYNRGWFPHVFSLINGLPAGATIHEMTDKIDLGPIIAKTKVSFNSWDTSETLYKRIIDAEKDLLAKNISLIIEGKYKTELPETAGNLNTKADYNELLEFRADEKLSAAEFINRLRALSHGSYRNAFFIDNKKNKIYLRLYPEKDDEKI